MEILLDALHVILPIERERGAGGLTCLIWSTVFSPKDCFEAKAFHRIIGGRKPTPFEAHAHLDLSPSQSGGPKEGTRITLKHRVPFHGVWRLWMCLAWFLWWAAVEALLESAGCPVSNTHENSWTIVLKSITGRRTSQSPWCRKVTVPWSYGRSTSVWSPLRFRGQVPEGVGLVWIIFATWSSVAAGIPGFRTVTSGDGYLQIIEP